MLDHPPAIDCPAPRTEPWDEDRLAVALAAARHRHGVAVFPVDDITDPWLRQAIINEANRRWGRRNGGSPHGR